MILKNREEIVSNAFGLWISALFSDIGGFNPELSFVEQKDEFFKLIRELLEDGKIKFSTPNEFWKEGKDVWDVDPPIVLQYLIGRWPQNASCENDLSDYFYEIPAVLWVNDDGSMVGS